LTRRLVANRLGAAKNLGIIQARQGGFEGAKGNLLTALSLWAEDDGTMFGLLGLCCLMAIIKTARPNGRVGIFSAEDVINGLPLSTVSTIQV